MAEQAVRRTKVRRTAVLLGERDERLGRTTVPESTFVIRHEGAFYIRTGNGVRLPGGGIGVIFEQTEVIDRPQLEQF